MLLGATTCSAQIIFHKKKVNKSTSPDNNAQPDKILYDKAADDIKHGRQEVGRLGMQTLINTYPDSEFLAKAKLAIADSYYKEGGTANLTLAISGYKDFCVFFPFLPEATYAQMQVAMAHYRQMEKPDRDRTEALSAEEEFQIFLQKYPNDPLAPQAEQRLRDVQEVLAEGDYRIGYYYYVKGDQRAAATRLMTVASRYPLYSKSDRVLWMIGDIFEKSEKKEFAGAYYARIVRNYPLSSLVGPAKDKLKTFGAPVPQPDATAMAWMKAEQNAPRPKAGLTRKPLAIIKNGPMAELRESARNGSPNMQPESEATSFADLLRPAGGKATLAAGGNGGLVTTVTPGETGTTGTSAEGTGTTENSAGATDATTGTAAPPAGEQPKDPPAAAAPAAADPAPNAAATTSEASKAEGTTETPAKSDAAGGTDATAAPSADAAKANSDSKNGDKDPKESSSKKKKGLRKLVPW